MAVMLVIVVVGSDRVFRTGSQYLVVGGCSKRDFGGCVWMILVMLCAQR